jgi:hypothetical protein
MVMGCDIDSWAMDHFGKLRDINVLSTNVQSLEIIWFDPLPWLALFTFGNEIISSANRDDS